MPSICHKIFYSAIYIDLFFWSALCVTNLCRVYNNLHLFKEIKSNQALLVNSMMIMDFNDKL